MTFKISGSVLKSSNDLRMELAKSVSYKTQEFLLENLKEFVKRDLIAVEYGPMQLSELFDSSGHRYEYCQIISLKLKDQEYIEHLEEENKRLRKRLKNEQ